MTKDVIPSLKEAPPARNNPPPSFGQNLDKGNHKRKLILQSLFFIQNNKSPLQEREMSLYMCYKVGDAHDLDNWHKFTFNATWQVRLRPYFI